MDLEMVPEVGFLVFLEDIQDHRDEFKITYPLREILLIGFCTIIVGGEGWEDMEMFGNAKLRFLKKYYPFENGIPRAITFERIFSMINPKEFENILTLWTDSMPKRDKTLSIDGKCVRGSADAEKGKSAIHLLSAWGHQSGLILAQDKVDDKSNEITAIPNLLNALDIKGVTILMDAMGCQKNIAEQIVNKKGDYVLGLKQNHPTLYNNISNFFARHEALNFAQRGYDFLINETTDKGHGRIEIRKVILLNDLNWLIEKDEWKGMKSIVMINSTRIIGGKITTAKRFYISSLQTNAEDMAEKIRDHWGIENKCHWILDAVMNEDALKIRKKHADRNLSTMRRIALNAVKINKKKKNSIKGSRKLAGWDNNTLKRFLMF